MDTYYEWHHHHGAPECKVRVRIFFFNLLIVCDQEKAEQKKEQSSLGGLG